MLKDVLRENLKVVFCGTAKGKVSATKGFYYAGPGNKFYAVLHHAGFTAARLSQLALLIHSIAHQTARTKP